MSTHQEQTTDVLPIEPDNMVRTVLFSTTHDWCTVMYALAKAQVEVKPLLGSYKKTLEPSFSIPEDEFSSVPEWILEDQKYIMLLYRSEITGVVHTAFKDLSTNEIIYKGHLKIIDKMTAMYEAEGFTYDPELGCFGVIN